MKTKKKVFVGISGGVDSSVSLALLQKQGFDVVGVFIKVWQPDFIQCTWKEDRLDAMRVCATLDVPFMTLDLEEEYKKEVIDYMISEYKLGRTPNPDVMCNKYVKFGAFYTWARNNGADYVATGHYAKTIKNIDGSVDLCVAEDNQKDQTYFLWTLSQEILQHTIFPIGEYKKNTVRELAHKFKLKTATKKDSQGLCFIGKIDIKDFLKMIIKTELGNVLNESGQVIGVHSGAILYTIGERHGFTIIKKTTNDVPLYVISKDIKNNTITVSPKIDGHLPTLIENAKIIKTNWTNKIPIVDKVYMARSRYREELVQVKFSSISDSGADVVFIDKKSIISQGQSLVFYDDLKCIGGGTIE